MSTYKIRKKMSEYKHLIRSQRAGKWDDITKEEFNFWLEDNWRDWFPDIVFNMLNENKPHALADLKHEIKDNYEKHKKQKEKR